MKVPRKASIPEKEKREPRRPHFLPDGWAERGGGREGRRERLDGLGNFSFVVCSAVLRSEGERWRNLFQLDPLTFLPSSLYPVKEDGLDLVQVVQPRFDQFIA